MKKLYCSVKTRSFFKKNTKTPRSFSQARIIFLWNFAPELFFSNASKCTVFFHFSRISRYYEQCKKTLASLHYLRNQVLQFLFITTVQHKMQKLQRNFLQASLWERRAKFQRKIINFTRLRALRSSDFHKPKTWFLLNNNFFSKIKYRL